MLFQLCIQITISKFTDRSDFTVLWKAHISLHKNGISNKNAKHILKFSFREYISNELKSSESIFRRNFYKDFVIRYKYIYIGM